MNPDNNSNKKESIKILIPVAALVVCLAIGLIAYMLIRKPDKPQPAATQTNEKAEAGQTNPEESAQPDSPETEKEPDTDQESDTDVEQEDNAQDTNESAADETVIVNTITDQTSVGDYVSFGTYEQDNNPENGKEPLEWRVLSEEDNRVLLITAEVIDEVCYNDVWEVTTWENCSLRAWLNSTFKEDAFAQEQIQSIVSADHTDEDGNYTSDQVFILNSSELRQYFSSDSDRTASATDYAQAQGVYEYTNGNCWYWIGDAGADPHYARYVNCEGAVLEYGMLVFNNSFGVRPAMWVEK